MFGADARQAVLVCAEQKTADLAAHALVRQPALSVIHLLSCVD